jgi:hypothetical protein
MGAVHGNVEAVNFLIEERGEAEGEVHTVAHFPSSFWLEQHFF